MKIFYVWDTETKIYAGTIQCKEQDRPENSTDMKPLPFKESNEIVWNGNAWTYQPMKEENA